MLLCHIKYASVPSRHTGPGCSGDRDRLEHRDPAPIRVINVPSDHDRLVTGPVPVLPRPHASLAAVNAKRCRTRSTGGRAAAAAAAGPGVLL
jgi:hypothetical protein